MKKEFWVVSFLHFFVDFFSVYALMNLKGVSLGTEGYAILVIAYDFLAFIPQPFLGALMEKSANLKYWGAAGCFFVILGSLIPEAISAILFFGLGNALFHVAEGRLILGKAERSAPLGVFISFGSIGLGLALSFANSYLFVILLLAFAILTALSCFINYQRIPYSFLEGKSDRTTLFLPLALIALGVFFRGFFGQYTAYGWTDQANGYAALILSLAVFLGKFSGGFLLDGIGNLPLILLSAALSFVCFFFPSSLALSLIGVFGVNLLMALTMEFMRRAMPSFMAFGFGLLAAALLIGYFSASLLKAAFSYQAYLVPVLIVLNGLTLLYSSFALSRKGRMSALPIRRKELKP